MELVWRNEKRKVKDLMPFEKNPRKLTPKQEDDLKTSLQKFNIVEPPAIDADNRIVSGHQRIKVLKLLGRDDEEIDVRVPNRKLTDEEFLEANLRMNKNQGEFDFSILNDIPVDLLHEVGFNDFEIGTDIQDIDIDMKKLKGVENLAGRDKYFWLWCEFVNKEDMALVQAKLCKKGKGREILAEKLVKLAKDLPDENVQ